MNDAADVNHPPGSTHVKIFYGTLHYYRRIERQHLNQVSEEWQILFKWFWWDFQARQWKDVGAGFCDRNLVPIDRSLNVTPISGSDDSPTLARKSFSLSG